MGMMFESPSAAYDYFVPVEYQPLIQQAIVYWFGFAWVLGLLWLLWRGVRGGAKKKKKKKKDPKTD